MAEEKTERRITKEAATSRRRARTRRGDLRYRSRSNIGYDHGYDVRVFYLGLSLDPSYVEGFVEGCIERIGEDDPDGEEFLRLLWEEGERGEVAEIVKGGCEVREGKPSPD